MEEVEVVLGHHVHTSDKAEVHPNRPFPEVYKKKV